MVMEQSRVNLIFIYTACSSQTPSYYCSPHSHLIVQHYVYIFIIDLDFNSRVDRYIWAVLKVLFGVSVHDIQRKEGKTIASQ